MAEKRNLNLSLKEIWKPVQGLEGYYEVSSFGHVRSLDRDVLYQDGTIHHLQGKMMKATKKTKGYYYVSLRNGGRYYHYSVHYLVAKHFVSGYEKGMEVNHLDECPSNNEASNLEWCTHKDNINYGSHNQKVIDSISKPIVQYDITGNFIREWKSQTEASKALNISQAHIGRCLKGKTKSAFGFMFVFKGEQIGKYEARTGRKKVRQLDLNGNKIRDWESLRSIERECGYSRLTIRECTLGKKEYAFNYKWLEL